ncbi:hypothetical protein JCM8115_006202 [Rhodotorula mucilaginosa]
MKRGRESARFPLSERLRAAAAALAPSRVAVYTRSFDPRVACIACLSPAFMSQLLNKPYDAFADEGADEDVQVDDKLAKKQQADYIHIRIQQRNGRKTITTLSGVPTEYDPKKLLKAFKKEFACNGSVEEHEEHGKVIQLQGDQRQKIMEMLIEEGIGKETIKMHGF